MFGMFPRSNREDLECTWRHQLPPNTSCYQVEDGTFFVFNEVPPYELSAVVNGRKITAVLPVFKEPLTCSGAHENALYFYSAPPRKRSYKLYRATIDEGAVEFKRIREVRNGDDVLHFAHHQPFYVTDSEIFDFDEEDGSYLPYFDPQETFFRHLRVLAIANKMIFRLLDGDNVDVRKDFYSIPSGIYTVVITVPDPSKTAVLARCDSEIVYVIAGDELIIIIDHSLVKRYRLLPKSKKTIDFNESITLVGVHKCVAVFSSLDKTKKTRHLWSVELSDRYCDKTAYVSSALHMPFYISSGITPQMQAKNLANLSIALPRGAKEVLAKTDMVSEPESVTPIGSTATSSRKVAKIILPSTNTSAKTVPTKPKPRVPSNSIVNLNGAMNNLQLASATASSSFTSDFLKTFKPLKILGQGSYGCVFEVEKNIDSKIRWKRAVKRIPLLGSEKEVNDALREVAAMESFNHPGIVRFHDAWKEQPPAGWQRASDELLMKELGCNNTVQYKDYCAFLYIQMELCPSTLSKWLSDTKVRDQRKTKSWFRQIVSAVGYIHKNGKIHRDLKPSNILISSDGVPKICDLGIIADCLIESGQEKAVSRTFAKGTSMYMAPEQFWGGYSSKVDVFALGLILVQLSVVITIEKANEAFDNYRAGRPDSVLDKRPDVKPLVALLTNVKDTERPNCEEILKHPFLA